jgi:transcriptional regulator with XRE-family HTH domain
MDTFPARLKASRECRGLTQVALADAVGCHVGSITAYELGLRTPRPARGIVIALALHVDPLWLREGVHSREVESAR